MLKQLIAAYGAKMLGSVFRVILNLSYRIWICWDLSSICPDSRRKLNLKLTDRFMMLEKLIKWQKSRTEHCEFTKKIVMHEFWQEKRQETEINEKTENLQCDIM